MRRDFITVFGNQGCGKTVWTKLYGASKPRLLVYDPKAEYPNVDYVSNPSDWVPDVISRRAEKFRYGTYYAEEIELFGNAAYAAGKCTLIMEECAMLFNRGEDIAPWARPLIFMGREPEVSLVLVAQRANRIPIDIRSQANRIITFFQSEPDDVKAIAARIGKEYTDEITTLPPLHCLDWEPGRPVRRYPVRP
jgi:hypothetical protein